MGLVPLELVLKIVYFFRDTLYDKLKLKMSSSMEQHDLKNVSNGTARFLYCHRLYRAPL
jgi:hypothetical protein